MGERADFHIRANKAQTDKVKELTGLSNREIFEFGLKTLLEQNQNMLDTEILELHDAMDKVNELTESIRMRLKDKEVPTRPGRYSDDENEIKRNIIPLDLLKEMILYYMDEYNINELSELSNKNKEIFQFVIINISHYNLKMDELDDLYEDINSD